MGVWFGYGGCLIDIWVGTWDRVFHSGTSEFCFSFKNTVSQRYRDNVTSFSVVSSSWLETTVGDTLVRASVLSVGLGVSEGTIVSGSCTRSSHSWISHLLTSSLSIGISSLFCRVTQCMWGMYLPEVYWSSPDTCSTFVPYGIRSFPSFLVSFFKSVSPIVLSTCCSCRTQRLSRIICELRYYNLVDWQNLRNW